MLCQLISVLNLSIFLMVEIFLLVVFSISFSSEISSGVSVDPCEVLIFPIRGNILACPYLYL